MQEGIVGAGAGAATATVASTATRPTRYERVFIPLTGAASYRFREQTKADAVTPWVTQGRTS